MTPAHSTALALPDYEHPESRVPGFRNSTVRARPSDRHSFADDDDWAVRTLYARLAADRRTGVLTKKLTASPPPDSASPFTTEPTEPEGAEPALLVSAIPDNQPGYPAPNGSVPEVDGRRLADASSVDGILGVLRDHGHTATLAEEIANLIGRLVEEPDEPPPNTESLKLLARAVFAEGRLSAPRSLALTKDGYLHAEWYLGEAKLFMTFLPTAHIKVVVVHPGTGGDDALRVAGSLYSPNTESLAKWLASSLQK